MYKHLKLEVDADGVALLTLDLADRPMNVFTPGFTVDLRAAVAQIAQRADIRGAVITSGKANGFLAGADLKDFAGLYAQGLTAAQGAQQAAPGALALRELELCGKPVAAAINGLALGGGYELCLACHHRVLLDDSRAFVGLPEVTVGLLPGGGGTQRLPRLLGIASALPLLLSGRRVAPAEALMLGLVDAVAPASGLLPAARRWVLGHPGTQQPWDLKGYRLPGGAGPMASHAAESFGLTLARLRAETQDNYPAPQAILSAVYEGTQLPFERGLHIEAQYFGQLLANPVSRNLMRTLFVNRGAAGKRARGAVTLPRADVARLGLIGTGPHADALAEAAAAARIEIVRAAAGAMPPMPCDLVADADLGDKPPGDVVGLRLHTLRPDAPLMEIVAGVRTAPIVLARALDLAQQLRATPIVVRGGLGAYTAHLARAYAQESRAMCEEGVLPALVNNAARRAGYAAGPLDGARPTPVATAQPAAQPGVEALQQRLLCIQALTAVQCMEAGMLSDPADADLGGVLGCGFPAWTGGPLSYIETVGVSTFVARCDRLAERHGGRFRPPAGLRQRALNGEGLYPGPAPKRTADLPN
ncbi:hypothetical protein RD110_26280 [Rhodoferax koreense]|uniref:3-hydroxyacyl-CoA dehydrogenase n=1 Tax=Rhodoferax koreensis TaxID=1842727 RepID=A0A1P8K2P3_9BURK|nr:enoyl-CoA hydratase-related protein [Rhodoferax koreense]APW40274.1 hypothetical protein RD110_26280 [Rhodoferax koreense]